MTGNESELDSIIGGARRERRGRLLEWRDAAARQASLEECRRIMEEIMAGQLGPLPTAELAEAAAAIRAAERQKVYDGVGTDHYVTFAADGWTIEHPVECRLSGRMLRDCPCRAAVAETAARANRAGTSLSGRWRITGIRPGGTAALARDEGSAGSTAGGDRR
jgi:hypothetical protein